MLFNLTGAKTVARKRKKKGTKQVSTDANAASAKTLDTVLAEWTVHLARQQPMKAVIAGLLVSASIAFGWVWVHPMVAFLLGLFLLHAVGEFFFPVRYRITKEGAEAVGFLHWRKIDWERVRRVTLLPDGIQLSPLVKPSKLDAFRGLFLRWNGEEAGLQRMYELCRRCQWISVTD